MSLRSRKILFNKLLNLMHAADALAMEIDGEWVRTTHFERAALIISGFTAAMPMALEGIEYEIAQHEQEIAFNKELGLLMENEKNRLKLPNMPEMKPPASSEDDWEEEDYGDFFERGM